jgi:thymidine phosphorylase
MQPAPELILKKRDGHALGREELSGFVAGICDQSITDAQLAAFAMATWFRGMVPAEQMALTLAMRDSGRVLEWPAADGPLVDKHSTGGVGDMVSLVLGPVLAACGAFVPMISGRGLGHTGGTLDKLESIPGFKTNLAIDRFQKLVCAHGVAIVGQSSELVPADRRLYAVRNETSTVDSIPLIVSSILSKKLAEGLDALVMDIKFGSGAFMADPDEAVGLARDICEVSTAAGLPCNALITDMDQPLAWSAGNALEVREVIGFLRGDARHDRLLAVVLDLAAELMQMCGLAANPEAGRAAAQAALDSGRAAERFAAMVKSQGGPANILENANTILPVAGVNRPVFAEQDGFINRIDTRTIGMAVVKMGGGRRCAADTVDPSVGLSALAAVGQRVKRREPLAIAHASSEEAWEQAAEMVRAAMIIGAQQPVIGPVVHTRVTGEANHARE